MTKPLILITNDVFPYVMRKQWLFKLLLDPKLHNMTRHHIGVELIKSYVEDPLEDFSFHKLKPAYRQNLANLVYSLFFTRKVFM